MTTAPFQQRFVEPGFTVSLLSYLTSLNAAQRTLTFQCPLVSYVLRQCSCVNPSVLQANNSTAAAYAMCNYAAALARWCAASVACVAPLRRVCDSTADRSAMATTVVWFVSVKRIVYKTITSHRAQSPAKTITFQRDALDRRDAVMLKPHTPKVSRAIEQPEQNEHQTNQRQCSIPITGFTATRLRGVDRAQLCCTPNSFVCKLVAPPVLHGAQLLIACCARFPGRF